MTKTLRRMAAAALMFAVVGRAWSGDRTLERHFSVVSLPQPAIASVAIDPAPTPIPGLISKAALLSFTLPVAPSALAATPAAIAPATTRLALPSTGALRAPIAIGPSVVRAVTVAEKEKVRSRATSRPRPPSVRSPDAAVANGAASASLEDDGAIGRSFFDGESDTAAMADPLSPAPERPPQHSGFHLLRAGAARFGLAASLIATNVAAYAAVPPDQAHFWSFNPAAFREAILSLSAPGIEHGLLTAVTMMFMHAHFAHIASNMVGLAVIAPFVQRRYGFKYALLIFIGGGLAANIASMFFQNLNYNYMGASGSVFSLMGAFLAGQRPEVSGLTSLIVLEMIGQLWELCVHGPISADNAATGAHVAGAVFGALLAGLFILRDRRREPAPPADSSGAET